MNNINTGLNVKEQERIQNLPEKHVMGIGSVYPDLIKGHPYWQTVWFALKPETQFGVLETMGCTGYGTNNILEMIWKEQYKLDINLSDRFINKVSGTTRAGNTVDAPIDAIRKFGFLYEDEYGWDRDTFDWNDYYSAVPQDKLDLAKTRLDEWEFSHEYVPNNPEAIKQALKTSPLGGTVHAWSKDSEGIYRDYGYSPNHFTVVILDYVEGKYWICGDSYPDDFQYKDNPEQKEFIKKLAWDFKFGCIKRYKITQKDKKKTTFLTLKKSMQDFYYYWDGKHNFYRIGVPSGETTKFRQFIDITDCDVATRMLYIGLRETMNQSSWAEVSQYPDISSVNKKFA